MTLRKAGVCMTGILIFLLPAIARADVDSPPGRWWRIPEMMEVLNLSPKEKQTLESLFTEKRKVLFQIKSEVERQRFELENILENPGFTKKAALGQFNRLEENRQRLARERFTYLLEVRKILGRDRYLRLMAMARERQAERWSSSEEDTMPGDGRGRSRHGQRMNQ